MNEINCNLLKYLQDLSNISEKIVLRRIFQNFVCQISVRILLQITSHSAKRMSWNQQVKFSATIQKKKAFKADRIKPRWNFDRTAGNICFL